MREQIFDIIEPKEAGRRFSSMYDYAMMFIILVSLLPLTVKQSCAVLQVIDIICTMVFICDYLLRLITADFKLHRGWLSFLLYPMTPLALIDLLCILPAFTAISGGFRLLKILRLIRSLRVLKMVRHSKSLRIIVEVIRRQRTPLLTVCSLAAGYVLICALVIFNVEPDTFSNFFKAVYWAMISLTTMGYGDIYPITTVGRIVTMVSSFVGIAIVALPASIITAGYMEVINDSK